MISAGTPTWLKNCESQAYLEIRVKVVLKIERTTQSLFKR